MACNMACHMQQLHRQPMLDAGAIQQSAECGHLPAAHMVLIASSCITDWIRLGLSSTDTLDSATEWLPMTLKCCGGFTLTRPDVISLKPHDVDGQVTNLPLPTSFVNSRFMIEAQSNSCRNWKHWSCNFQKFATIDVSLYHHG